MQAKINGWMQYVLVGLVILSIIVSWGAYSKTTNVVVDADEIADAVIAGIVVPEVDTTNIDRVCELTDGCEFYTIANSQASEVRDVVEDKEDDFVDAFAELVGIDEDYLDIKAITLKDTQVRAYTEDDKDDKNYEVKLFYRVKYEDVDVDETNYAYIVVTSILDEGDYDSLTLEEVDRTFEFD